jgi:hypothetical protein
MKSCIAPLFVSALLVFSTACGPAKKAPKATPPETIELQATDSFLNTPTNTLEFVSISQGVAQVRYLTFKAPSDGYLSISKLSYGLAMGCQNAGPQDKYSFDYSYRLKDPTSGQYTREIQPEDFSAKEIQPTLHLKSQEEVQIRVILNSQFTCDNAKLMLTAVFRNF